MRETLVLVVRRDLTVVEFGIAVAHACEVMLEETDFSPDTVDVVIKGVRSEEVLLEVDRKLRADEKVRPRFYAFKEEATSPHTGEPFRLGGQLVSIGIEILVREVALGLDALVGLHSLESLDGPRVERKQCEGVWPNYKQKEKDGSPWRCKNMCAPGEKFCAKDVCKERRA